VKHFPHTKYAVFWKLFVQRELKDVNFLTSIRNRNIFAQLKH
jgi:hypothetical protein